MNVIGLDEKSLNVDVGYEWTLKCIEDWIFGLQEKVSSWQIWH